MMRCFLVIVMVGLMLGVCFKLFDCLDVIVIGDIMDIGVVEMVTGDQLIGFTCFVDEDCSE